MTRAGVLLLVAPLLIVGCERRGARPGSGDPGVAEARALLEKGEYDAALAQLGAAEDPESLYLLGRAWAGKARLVGRVGGGQLSSEETRALGFLERAVEVRPDLAAAHLEIAELLAPHIPVEPAGGAAPPGVTVNRVLEAYGAAIQADPADTAAVEALIAFSTRVGRASEAEAGYRELIRRDRENPVVLVRFGDFLAGVMRDPAAAQALYAQALMWRPDDNATRLKIADIHLDAASGHLELSQYAAVEAELREARKYVGSAPSAQADRLRETDRLLAEASGRR